MLVSANTDVSILLGFAALAVVALLSVHSLVLIETVKQIGQIRSRLDVDDKPVFISLGDATGRYVPSLIDSVLEAQLLASAPGLFRGPTVLVFLSPDCRTCRIVAEGLPEIRNRHRGTLTTVPIVDSRELRETERFLEATQLSATDVVVNDGSLARALGVNAHPTVVVLRDGRVREAATINNATQLARLADDLTLRTTDELHRLVDETKSLVLPQIGGVDRV